MKTIKDLTSIDTPNDSAEIWVQDQAATGVDRRWSLANIATWVISKLGTSATKNMASGVSAFGTASGRDVTTSSTDTTSGRVLKVGDFGLGDNGGLSLVSNADSLTVNSLARHGSSATNLPTSHFGVILNQQLSADSQFQLNGSVNLNPARMWFRNRSSGTWRAWQELYHTGNYPSDTAWTTTTTLLNGWTGTVRYIKRAGMVTVVFDGLNATSRTGTDVLILPIGYRPSLSTRIVVNDGGSILSGTVFSGGSIGLAGSSSNLVGSITYPIIT